MLLVERRIISNQTPGGGTAEALTSGTLPGKKKKKFLEVWEKKFLTVTQKDFITDLPPKKVTH
jgi:hypothetical protein